MERYEFQIIGSNAVHSLARFFDFGLVFALIMQPQARKGVGRERHSIDGQELWPE